MLTDVAQNYETENSHSNFCFSLILNPIEVFFAATERSRSLLQLIQRFNIFLDQLKHEKLPRTETVQIDGVLRKATRTKP